MADLIKVSIQGTLPGGEVWSVNPVYEITTGEEITFPEATAIVTAVNGLTIGLGLKTLMSSGTAITGCRVEARTVGGVLEVLAEGTRATPVVGTGSGGLPYQSSLVQSLRTMSPGGSGRGRLYWPATGLILDSATLRVTTSNMGTIAPDLKNFLLAIQGAVDASVDETVALAVWSRTTNQLHRVTSTQMGNVVDTQRRRRDAIAESRTVTAFP